MDKRFKSKKGSVKKTKTEHKIYLQVQLSGGFWDTIHWETLYNFLNNDTMFDEEISRLLKEGFKVRILAIFTEQTEIIEEIIEEIK